MMVIVPKDLENRLPLGRQRQKTLKWRLSPYQQRLTSIKARARISPETAHLLIGRLGEIRAAGKHVFPGTTARYITRATDYIELLIIWRPNSIAPQAIEEAIAAFFKDLADLVEEITLDSGDEVLMHT